MHKRVVEVDLIDILNVVLKGNPLNSFTKLWALSVDSHIYLSQWKELKITLDTIEKVIDIIKRFEANHLQLRGKGVWLLSMCLTHCYDNVERLPVESQESLVEIILRIALEEPIHVECIEVLQLILNKMELTADRIFGIGLTLTDQLPSVVRVSNFISLLNFGVKCMASDRSCFEKASLFLARVGEQVPFDYKVYYFLSKLCSTLRVPLLEADSSEDASFVDLDGVRIGTLTLLTRLVNLSPSHPAEVVATGIPALVVALLDTHMREGGIESSCSSSLSPELIGKCLTFLTAVAQDPPVRKAVRAMVPHSLLLSLLEAGSGSGCVVESCAGLFLTLNSTHNFEQLYAGRPKKRTRPEMVHFLTRIFETALIITKEEVRLHRGESTKDAKVSSDFTSAEAFLANDHSHKFSGFDMLNRLLRLSAIHVKLNEVNELFPVLDDILHHLMAQMETFERFNLLHTNIIDSVVLLLGRKERCWWPPRQDPLDIDFQNVSADLVTQFSKVTVNNKLFDTNDMTALNYLAGTPSEEEATIKRTLSLRAKSPTHSPSRGGSPLPGSPMHQAQQELLYRPPPAPIVEEPTEVDEEAVIGAKQLEAHEHLTRNLKAVTAELVQNVLFLQRFLDKWETEEIEVTSRKLLLIFTLVSINGVETMRPLFSITRLAEVAWELLNDSRLGLEAYPDMQRKCIQLLGLIAQQSPTTPSSGEIVEYLLKILTTKEDNGGSLPLLYSSLSCLLALADKDRAVRRKIVTNFGKMYEQLESLDMMDSLTPLLHLAGQMTEFMTKLELDGEQCLVTLILRSLQSKNKKITSHACDLICDIGQSSPGIIHRGICRREVEDVLLSILTRENVPHNPRLILSVLKACNAIVHDVNLKPLWVPNPWGYHWMEYKSNFTSRPILNCPFVDILQNVMTKALPTYRMLYFAVCLSIASSLMYNCSDGIVNPSNKLDVANLSLLKDALIASILPWLPIAVDFITIGKKNTSTSKPPPNIVVRRGSLNAMMNSTKGSHESFTLNLIRKALNLQGKEDDAFQPIAPSSGGGGSGTSTPVNGSTHHSGKNSPARTAPGDELVTDVNPAAPKRNLAMEYLTEKTVNGLYSFLCNDEMFPLSTYLRNVGMFQRTPVIACVSYFMTENKTNLTIQRRGMDFIKYFTDNQIGLSSIAMHSPSALMIACHALKDITEVQYSFCKIISAVSKSDDFARDNLIRFHVHTMLQELIMRQHPEQSRLALIAVTDLCSSDLNIISICQNTGLVEAIVACMDGAANDIKIQVEGLRALCAINQVPEFLVQSKKQSIFQVLNKTKRFLQTALKNDKTDHFERGEIEELLSDPLWKNEKCTIS